MKRGGAEADGYDVRLMKRGVKKNKDYGVRLMRDEEGSIYRGRLRKREDGGPYGLRKREEGGPYGLRKREDGGPYGLRLMKRTILPARLHSGMPGSLTSRWWKREDLPEMDEMAKVEYAPLMAGDIGVVFTEGSEDESQFTDESKIGQRPEEAKTMKEEYNRIRKLKRNYDGIRMMKRYYEGKKKKTYNGIRLMKK